MSDQEQLLISRNTKRIQDVGELMGITLDDHIIIAGDDFVSALE